MTDLDYTIAVPSRKRAHNMPILRMLLPTAVICVDEREMAEYSIFVPKDKLLPHPPLANGAAVQSWMMDNIDTPILFRCDDDLRCVRGMTGSHRRIVDPEEILAIIENAARCCQDLGLGVFTFAATANPIFLNVEEKPIKPVQPTFGAFGVMGKALKTRRFDPDLVGRSDADFTLQTLLDDRILYADCRFKFDFGLIFGGRGGNVGLITPKIFRRSTLELKRKWGKHVSFQKVNFQKKRTVSPISIRVKRSQTTAQR